MSSKKLILEGLTCASCASKIEEQTNKIQGVKAANINFVSKILSLELNGSEKSEDILAKVKTIVKELEPDVKVLHKEDYDNERPHGHDHRHKSLENKRELVLLALGAFLFAIVMLFSFTPWVELMLYIISYLLVGGKILLRAGRNILRGQVFDENFLMGIATLGAFAIGEYPEAVAVMLFYQVGEFFQSLAVNRSRKSIKELMDIRPDFANLKIGNDLKVVNPESVNIGDYILIKPGEKIPLDGQVIEGESMIDTSALTGESVPRKVRPAKDVLSGSINKTGLITVKVTKSFGESTVSKILQLVENASNKKAPTEQFISKFTRYYTPVVVYSALALAIIPPLFVPGASFNQWIYRALVFLVISCPCALVVSIPLGFFGGIGGASKRGILVKGGNYLEALNNIDTIVMDKTGTLTKGVFEVTDIESNSSITDEELLEYAAYAETYSNHPIGQSILKEYGKEVNRDYIDSYTEISGHGIKAIANNKGILAGNAKLMKSENIKYKAIQVNGTIVHIAIDRDYMGYIVISDKIKEDSKKAIDALRTLGVRKIAMLTGDTKLVGENVAAELGLDEVYTELLPDEKVAKVEALNKEKTNNGKLVFVGDGINDAPVLAMADIGIAMGALGSDAAIEAADIVLMTDEPSKIITAIKIAKKTRKVVLQNIVFALGVKAFVLLLGAFGIATMWEAVFADVGVSLLAVLNSLRVLKVNNL